MRAVLLVLLRSEAATPARRVSSFRNAIRVMTQAKSDCRYCTTRGDTTSRNLTGYACPLVKPAGKPLKSCVSWTEAPARLNAIRRRKRIWAPGGAMMRICCVSVVPGRTSPLDMASICNCCV